MDLDYQPITLPSGVTLRAPEDFDTLRTQIYDSAKNKLAAAFPASYNGVRVELADVDYADPPDFDLDKQKEAILGNKFLGRRLRGTIRLLDEKDNSVLDQRQMTLMKVPYLSPRGTFQYNGSEYAHVHQARMQHGAFTRRQNNGDLETQFNVKHGTGSAFRVGFEPSTAQYRLRVGSSNLHLYSLLKDLGESDEKLAGLWGEQVLERNRGKYDARVLDKAYEHFVPRREQKPDLTPGDKAAAVRAAMDKSMVHYSAVKRTLPSMLGGKSASDWRAELGVKMAAHAKMAFAPDIEPTIAVAIGMEGTRPDAFYEVASMIDDSPFVKIASAQSSKDVFAPDLQPEEMQEAYDAIYSKVGPRLASMDKWPERWFNEDSDPMGWISWYMNYANGARTPDDERQIGRWKSFKARHGQQFKQRPTARRAFALRYWAIDPLQMLDDPEDKKRLESEMADYRRERMDSYMQERELKKHDYGDTALIKDADVALLTPGVIPRSLRMDPWFDGVVKSAAKGKEEREKFKGCIMARFSEVDERTVAAWVNDNIPPDMVADDGYERETHVTVLYGVGPDVSESELAECIKETRNGSKFPVFVKLGEIERFPAHPGRPDSDVLVIRCDAPGLADIHHAIREKFGDKVRVTWPDYRAHLTLAYVKSGELKKLDGHCAFEGMLLPVQKLIYSLPDRSDKIELKTRDE